jgi:hypothetical protein
MTVRPVMTVRPLLPTGKPMRALTALRRSTPENPLTEYDIYRACQSDAGRAVPDWIPESFHGPLRTLVKRGFAEQCPRAHSRAQWYITPVGLVALGLAEGDDVR